jgi:two-component sensor histidine kinase
MRWIEIGGPAAHEPTRRGFGSGLIERSVAQDLSGRAELRFLPAGLQCELTFPLTRE